LIFHEDFTTFDTTLWKHEVSLYGGYNGEFQWYTNDPANSYVRDGSLYITPTLTYKYLPCQCQEDLYRYKLNLTAEAPFICTNADREGCYMEGNPTEVINPIRSTRVNTTHSFRFKYGMIEVRAKIPRGDWLWPAIWLMPANSVYGGWPQSGEIDLMEARCNDEIISGNVNMGNFQVGQTLHYGSTHAESGTNVNSPVRFSDEYHLFKLKWTPDNLTFEVDEHEPWTVTGPFGGNYTGSSSIVAPFDQEFYFLLNVAVGGTMGYFPDNVKYSNGKPWTNEENKRVAQTKFWESKDWTHYEMNPDESSMKIDYIKVWAI